MSKIKSATSNKDNLSDESINGCITVDDSSSEDIQIVYSDESPSDCIPIKNFVNHLQDSCNVPPKKVVKNKFKSPITIKTNLMKPLPNILRHSWSAGYKIPRRKTKIPREFEFNESNLNVTIGPSIIPESVIKKRETKSDKQNHESSSESQYEVDTSTDSDELDNTIDTNTSVLDESIPNLDDSVSSDDKTSLHFYCLRNKVICALNAHKHFSFHGKLKIKVLYGAVEIYGYTLNKSNTITPVEIYSPRSSNLLRIQSACSSESSDLDDLSVAWDALKEDNIDCNSEAFTTFVDNIQPGWSVFTLQNFDNNLTDFIERHFSHRLFPTFESSTNNCWTQLRRAEIILQSYIFPTKARKRVISFNNTKETVETVVNDFISRNSSRIILAGAKNLGKSTTTRYLVNKLLQKTEQVIVLDFDPGQSEFTPAGCVSMSIVRKPLLGPNFTHLERPFYQFYIGGIDVTRCLTNYIEGIKKIIECSNNYLDKHNNSVPVIVNTMGFCKDLGWDIMCYIIKSIEPTDVIQINSKKTKCNYDNLLQHQVVINEKSSGLSWTSVDNTSLNEYKHYLVYSDAEFRGKSGETWNIEPHQLRDIAMLAYLSDITKVINNTKSYFTSTSIPATINEITPYQISFSSVKISLGFPVVSHVLSVINGNIVALCGTDFDDDQCDTEKVSYPKVLVRAPLATCYGFGIVRGIDMEQEKIFLNTPLSVDELKYVNCLIGSIQVPAGLRQLNKSGLPYTSGECNLPTSRDPRRGCFHMKNLKDTSLLSIDD
ncbi:GSCOCG00005372001-RA-CDS [Cotesia congregata]|uniref:Polynucleotide 5'-hydroxyl-kinase NOL9 n=1 Tax=Cotesia congregata TaxID=51543 RepID=A0A8J2HIE9_COTCN|nr:GSCOCG00005372001-RA-CDS [Cotesia congregata]CAG5100879.1 Similar to Nol9: Polynucleotide 5'-hydroxyl-kinase NOL9 (Mus musculus) [Cotesia congregata]